MGLFTEDKKVKIRPEVLAGSDYLKTLLESGTPTVPTQGTADLTPVQQLIMSTLPGMVSGTQEASQTARDYYSGVLNDNYDVFNDPRYEAIRTESERLTRAGQTSLRRGAERFGQLDSTPAKVGEAEFLSQSGSNLLKSLGELLTYKEGQKERAAGNIQNVPAREIQNVGAISSLADTERSVEQMRADALYQSALMQILFPYQYQAGLANSLMNMPGGVQVTGGGLTDLGFYFQTMASGAGAAAGAAAACDENLKHDIITIESALDKIAKLDGKTYHYNGVENRRHAGVIAQDVEDVLPEAVEMINGYRYVRFDGMIALLVNAVNELREKVESQLG